jgi:hypothetical protein
MQTVKEIPKLFSTEMVKAKLDNRKTITRRLKGLEKINETPGYWRPTKAVHIDKKGQFLYEFVNINTYEKVKVKCPYGKPGDLLWTRESWRVHNWHHEDGKLQIGFLIGETEIEYEPDDYDVFNRLWEQSCNDLEKAGYELQRDDDFEGDEDEGWRYKNINTKDLRLRPCIHMPKDVARLWDEVVSVCLERVQDISEEDAIAEGVFEYEDGTYKNYFSQKGLREQDGVECLLAKGSFQSLWCKINGLESWNANPWVWVIKFKVLSTTGKNFIEG